MIANYESVDQPMKCVAFRLPLNCCAWYAKRML